MSIAKAFAPLGKTFRGRRAAAVPVMASAPVRASHVADYARECPNCNRYVPALQGWCPGCGYRMPAAT